MPIYEFKCCACGKTNEIFLSFSEFNSKANIFGVCEHRRRDGKICGRALEKKDQQINFAGGINMNSSSVGVAHRKYSNRAGGPKPIIDGKVRNDLKIKGV